jgi:polygalacturonase
MRKGVNIPLITILATSLLLVFALSAADVEKKAWKQAGKVLKSIKEPKFPDRQFDIRDFGAKEAVEDYSNTAINKAIQECHKQGGGKVIVPAGNFFTGPIELKSNVCLHLEEGAVLKFSTNPEDYLPVVLSRWEGWDCYNLKPLIYAYEQENIAITGKGILDGQASSDNWWPWKSKKEYGWKEGMVSQEWNGDKEAGRNRLARMEAEEIPVEERIMSIEDRLRPPFFQPYLCKNVLVEGITINRSPFWLLHPLLCENVIIRGVTMDSHGPNNDGCDPESCKNVLIEDCYFNTGDDCIAIKSGCNKDGFRWNTPSENIIIRRCVMKDGHGGVVIGSEISGGCRNVWAEDCEMDSPNLDRIVRLKTNPLRGGTIENLFVRNIQVGECKESVMRMELKYERVTKGPNMPVIRNVILNNIQSNKSKYGVWIDGYTDHVSVHDILIRNCNFSNVEKGNLVIGAENVVFEEVFLNGKKVENQP